jgi:peptidoglycan/LPS O-acetylase OafA/YrhL
MVTGFFVVMLMVALGWFSRVRWRWLTVAGALTYPLYLLHRHFGTAMLQGLDGRVPHWASLVITVLGLLLLVLVGAPADREARVSGDQAWAHGQLRPHAAARAATARVWAQSRPAGAPHRRRARAQTRSRTGQPRTGQP